MKRIIIILAAITAVLMISACNMMSGSGIIVDTEFDLDGFTAVDADYTCDLTLTKGDDFSVIITSDDNMVDFLDVQLEGSVLKISLIPFTIYNNKTFKAEVVMPVLNELVVSGASDYNVTDFDAAGTLKIDISGASKGSISLNSVENVTAMVSGASKLDFGAEAITGNIDIECSGASEADFRRVTANNASVSVTGASTVRVNSNGVLSGNVSGASSLYYEGSPTISSVDVDISSTIASY